jgi:hypothetical protein
VNVDQLEIIFGKGLAGGGSTFSISRRNSLSDPFILGGPIPDLASLKNPKNAALSEEGLTLLFQQGLPSESELFFCTRSDRHAPWGPAQLVPMSSDSNRNDPLSWPFISDDGLTLWYCRSAALSPEIWTATRRDRQATFENHQPVIVSGTRLVGRAPRFVAATGELFYSAIKTEEPPDWSLWVVKDYQRLQPRVGLFDQSAQPATAQLTTDEVKTTSPDMKAAERATIQAVALFDRLGAKYEREPNLPHQPLTKVDATGTKFNDDGLAQLAGQDRLTSLNLAHTSVTEAGLVHLRKIPNLQSLELRTSDAGLAELAQIKSLKRLGVIAWSPITDVGLGHLKDMKNLEELNVSYNEITSVGIEHLRGLRRLSNLCLNATKVDDVGMAAIKDIKTLDTLWLGGCPVTDAGLAHLRGHSNLKALIVGNEHVTDATIGILRTVPKLELLYIGTSKLTDACLDDLAAIKTLRNLDVQQTQITPAGLERLRKALPLCGISPAASEPK